MEKNYVQLTDYPGNANHSGSEIRSHGSENNYIKKVKRQVLVGCGEKGALVHCW